MHFTSLRYRFQLGLLLLIFATCKSYGLITIQSPSAGQNVQIGDWLYFYFTYTTYSPIFNGDIYKGNTLIKTVSYLYNGERKTTNDLPPGNDYRVKIYGYNNPSDYAWSDYFNVIALPPPTFTYSNNVGASSFLLSWTSVSGASSYRLDVSTSSDFSALVLNDVTYLSTSYNQLTGMASGTKFYCRVRAVGTYGPSANSPTFIVTTMPAAPVAKPAWSVTAGAFGANWDLSVGASHYYLDVATDNSFTNYVSGFHDRDIPGNYEFVNGLAANTIYYYRVRALSSSGYSVYSNTISTGTLPSAPVITSTLNLGSTSFLLNWSPISGASFYRLDVSTTYDYSALVLNDASYYSNSYNELTGLTPGTTYYCRVRTVGTYGTSENSITFSVTTKPGVPAPNPASNVTTNSFVASWGGVQGATGGYLLDVALDYGFTNYLSGYHDFALTGTSATITGLTANTSYYYRVRSVGTFSTSVYSGTITAWTLLPAPIINQTTSIGTSSFVISWTGMSGALSYRVDVATNSSFTEFILNDVYYPTYMNPLTISSGINSSTTYWYRIRAYNSTGPSQNSITGSARTLAIPPTALNASNINSMSFVANWTSAPSAQSYRLDVSNESSFTSFLPGYSDLVVNSTSELVTVPTGNINYYYRVRNFDGEQTSINSNASRVGLIKVYYPSEGQVVPAGSDFIISYHPPQYVIGSVAELYQGNNPIPITSFSGVYGDNRNTISSSSIPVGENYRIRIYDGTNKVTEGWSGSFSVVNNVVNYIKEETINIPGVTDANSIGQLSIGQKSVSFDYYDGLGRMIQSVEKAGSFRGKDIVQPFKYDGVDRQSISYLPFTEDEDGWFKENALENPLSTETTEEGRYQSGLQFGFYQLGGELPVDSKPFSKVLYEESPLLRPQSQGSAGSVWQPVSSSSYTTPSTNDKTVKFAYQSNTSEEVLSWKFLDDGQMGMIDAGTSTQKIYFTENSLYKNKTKDEDNNESIKYYDKMGRLVLKRVQVAENASLNDSDYASTYYVYNAFGNLACVITPQAVEEIMKSPSEFFDKTIQEKKDFLKRWVYLYRYDSKRRMIAKQTPGSQPIYIVYDDRDRVVLRQDGEQRKKNEWDFNKYDFKDRPVITGIYVPSIVMTRENMQNEVNGYYNNLSSSQSRYESFTTEQNSIHGYDNKSFPYITDPNVCLTVNYYDNYQFKSFLRPSYNYSNSEMLESQTKNGITYSLPTQASSKVLGMVTGTRRKNLLTGSWMNNAVYYDEMNNVIQVIGDNNMGGENVMTSLADFNGQLLKSKTREKRSSLQWKDLYNCQSLGAISLQNGSGDGWGSGGAASVQMLAANTDGWMEVSISEKDTYRMIGFSPVNQDQNYESIKYAIYQRYDFLQIYESGNDRGINLPVSVGDVIRIKRIGNTISYFKNEIWIADSPTTSTEALLVDVAFGGAQSTIQNIRTSFSNESISTTETFMYDNAGRVLKRFHSVNDNTPVLLAMYDYNELGELSDKKLFNTDPIGASDQNRAFKQSIDYRYNIRGWIKSINDSDLQSAINIQNDSGNFGKDLFGMNFVYNETTNVGNTPSYSGNISAISWSNDLSTGEVKEKAYNLSYDPINRLKTATLKKRATNWNTSSAFYESGISYDLNGNITHLNRSGKDGNSIDNLVYNYGEGTTKSNRLLFVDDGADVQQGFIDGNLTENDYGYDDNGNITIDRNKGVVSPQNTEGIIYNRLYLPEKILKSNAAMIKYVYNAGGSKVQEIHYDNSGALKKRIDYNGQFFYQNDTLKFIHHAEGRVVMTSSSPEYQFNLEDHLDNTRILFTTKPEEDLSTATLEDNSQNSEVAQFLNYSRVTNDLFDHTDVGNVYDKVQLLNGGYNSQVGIAKSFSVMPGDVIRAETYAKYNQTTGAVTNLNTFAAALLNAFGLPNPAIGELGTPSAALNNLGQLIASGGNIENEDWPSGWLNVVVFDKDFNLVDFAFEQLNSEYAQSGAIKSPHQLLSRQIEIKEPGFVYIYVSNEGAVQQDIYFDDFSVTHQKSPVIQQLDYYPFGMSYNSYSRENSLNNQFLFNGGSQLEPEMDLNYYNTLFRTYDPALGRFLQVDPFTDFFSGITPYSFAFDNPLMYNDPDGLAPIWFIKLRGNLKQLWYNMTGRGNEHAVVKGYHGRSAAGVKIPYIYGGETAGVKPTPGPPRPTPVKVADNHTKDEDKGQTKEEDDGKNIDPGPPLVEEQKPPVEDNSNNVTKKDNVIEISEDKKGRGTPFARPIAFEINSGKIIDNAANRKMLDDLSKTLKDFPETTLLIVGNAGVDKGVKLKHFGNTKAALAQGGYIDRDKKIFLSFGQLMTERANSVYKALVKRGISPSRLKAVPGVLYDSPKGRKTTFVIE